MTNTINVDESVNQLVESLCQSKGWMHSYALARVMDAIEPTKPLPSAERAALIDVLNKAALCSPSWATLRLKESADMLAADANNTVVVTCQTYGHIIGACAECNTHAEEDINETNAVLADHYLKMTCGSESAQADAPLTRQGVADDIQTLVINGELPASFEAVADAVMNGVLAADAQRQAGDEISIRCYQAKVDDMAQQVEVPQGWSLESIEGLCVSLDRVGVIGNGDKSVIVAASLLRSIIAAAPQLPQAERDQDEQGASPMFWYCDFGKYGQITMRQDEADSALKNGAKVMCYGSPQAERVPMTEMVDAAMVEMQTMHPPMRRSDCERLIRAAIEAHHHIGVKS